MRNFRLFALSISLVKRCFYLKGNEYMFKATNFSQMNSKEVIFSMVTIFMLQYTLNVKYFSCFFNPQIHEIHIVKYSKENIKFSRTSLVAQKAKNLPVMQETRIPSLGQEEPQEGNGNPF